VALDLTGAVVVFTLWEDGHLGTPLLVQNAAVHPASGSVAYPWIVSVEIPAAITGAMVKGPHYEYSARFEKGSREMTLATGRVYVEVVD
jgi:hypothetical protein